MPEEPRVIIDKHRTMPGWEPGRGWTGAPQDPPGPTATDQTSGPDRTTV